MSTEDSAPPRDDLERLREDLTAFLDHELDPAEARRLEDRLAGDPVARRELERLEQAWNALDDLPRPQVTERFTRTTVEFVTRQLEEELQALPTTPPPVSGRRNPWRGLGPVLLFAGAALATFVAFRATVPDPNRLVLEKLPILERLDRYRAVGDPEFLEELHRRNLPPEGKSHGRP